ncbi:universal stress protein [Psychromonas sp. KJ10-10]|uniref:universal stress protein n=1 Tax=Psychromonas sp. KJ10-10 TaxID=3391823 RepID=UPI0039B47AE4
MNYKNILVAVDLSESSNLLIRKAISIARISEAKISFVFVDLSQSLNNTALSYDEYQFATIEPDLSLAEKHRQQLQDLADSVDYHIDNCFYLTGDIPQKLQEEVKELGADLLVCGHHHHNFWTGFLSSLPKIVNASITDVFIVQLE